MSRPISLTIERADAGLLARAGVLHTPHGDVKTPAFVGVATKATIKGVSAAQFGELGVQCIIANTYHLYLSPGEEVVATMGGVGTFMGWQGPTMTDSGGFQVFSLGEGYGKKISKVSQEKSNLPDLSFPAVYDEDLATSHGKLAIVDEEGVSFTSHVNGSLHRFTPERSIEIQHQLGADIIYAFDECTSPAAGYEYQKEAAARTHRWASRSLKAHRQNLEKNNSRGIYGVVQGGRFADLRIESAKTLGGMDFDGYGIGGSFSKNDILGILDKVNNELPQEKPRHLLGIGEPEDIFIGVAAGIDTFDCVLPTRNGRSGGAYTHTGKLLIEKAEFKDDAAPIDSTCDCAVCMQFSRSYIHHLFRTGEMLGPMLLSAHNIRFLTRLCEQIRVVILDGKFEEFRDFFLQSYKK